MNSGATNSGQSTRHPFMKMTWKRALKIERVARLVMDTTGYTNAQIANHLRCTEQTIILIKQQPEFHAKMLELSSGVLSEYDKDLRAEELNAREELKSMVPSALMVIRNALLSKNESIRLKASMEVMDREGHLAKVSKSSVSLDIKPDLNVDPQVQSNLLALLAGAPTRSEDAPNSMAPPDKIGFTSKAQAHTIRGEVVGADIATYQDTEKLLEDLDIAGKALN